MSSLITRRNVTRAALAAGTGAALLGFQQEGASAVASTVQEKAREFPSVFDFMTAGQIADVRAGTALIDVTVAIQAAVNAHSAVFFPEGTYRVTSTITCARFGQCLFGPGSMYAPAIIQYGGSGTVFVFAVESGYPKIKNGIYIKGLPTVATDYYNTGSTGVDITAGNVSIEIDGCWISNFETLVVANFNGFYNKVTNSRFEKFRRGLCNFANANLHVVGNRFLRFNEAVRCNGANGPTTLTKNSFEIFNGPIYVGVGSEVGHIEFDGNYVEIYDSIDLPTNFPASAEPKTTKFGGNVLFTGPVGVYRANNNELLLGGCRRILSSATAVDYLESSGNTIHLYGAGNNMDYMFNCPAVKTLRINDRLGVAVGKNGGYARAYIQSAIAQSSNAGQYEFYDCIAARQLYPAINRTALTPINGWTALDMLNGAPSAFKKGDVTVLSGAIDGTARTDIVAFQVPAFARPTEYGTTRSYANFTLFSSYGAGSIIRFRYFYDTGEFRQEGAPASLQAIPLDGILIPPRY